MNEENQSAVNNAAQPVANQQATTTVNVDYDKMAEALDKRSNGFMKSYLKEQGLSEDEMKEAIKTFKNNKSQKEAETQTNLTNVQSQLQDSQAENRNLKVENTLYSLADELNVDRKNVPYLIKMANLENCFNEKGEIQADKVKEAANKVLEDIPGLKKVEEKNDTGITIGANNENASQASGNIFGFNFTGVRKH